MSSDSTAWLFPSGVLPNYMRNKVAAVSSSILTKQLRRFALKGPEFTRIQSIVEPDIFGDGC